MSRMLEILRYNLVACLFIGEACVKPKGSTLKACTLVVALATTNLEIVFKVVFLVL